MWAATDLNWENLLSPSKISRALKIESKALRAILRYGRPNIILHFLGGLGDELLLTCLAREFRKRSPAIRIWQISAASDLLQNNPDYTAVFSHESWALRHSNLLKPWRTHLGYAEIAIPGIYDIPPKEHILTIMCRKAGINGSIQLRPWYYQNKDEAVMGRLAKNQIAIHSVGRQTHISWMPNKMWYHDRFQKVVKQLRNRFPDYQIIQIGLEKDPALEYTLDLRGKTSLRQTAAILSQSDCFIGTSGFLSHLARAVDCRSVIIYGGREHSWQFGYACNENLESRVPCAPCGLLKDCDFERKCMDMIEVEHVVEAVERVISNHQQPLEVDEIVVTNADNPIPRTYPKMPGSNKITNFPPFKNGRQ